MMLIRKRYVLVTLLGLVIPIITHLYYVKSLANDYASIFVAKTETHDSSIQKLAKTAISPTSKIISNPTSAPLPNAYLSLLIPNQLPTNTPIIIVIPTETPTPTETPAPTFTPTPTPTEKPTETPTPTFTPTPTPTEKPTETPNPTESPSPTSTATETPTPIRATDTLPTFTPTPFVIPIFSFPVTVESTRIVTQIITQQPVIRLVPITITVCPTMQTYGYVCLSEIQKESCEEDDTLLNDVEILYVDQDYKLSRTKTNAAGYYEIVANGGIFLNLAEYEGQRYREGGGRVDFVLSKTAERQTMELENLVIFMIMPWIILIVLLAIIYFLLSRHLRRIRHLINATYLILRHTYFSTQEAQDPLRSFMVGIKRILSDHRVYLAGKVTMEVVDYDEDKPTLLLRGVARSGKEKIILLSTPDGIKSYEDKNKDDLMKTYSRRTVQKIQQDDAAIISDIISRIFNLKGIDVLIESEVWIALSYEI
ncbi:MAG: hypothetical protein NZM04_09550 [Methylacidiphilales bacterium]|nr:hypothetical protein [Candidatus Methylacidiphilales bacterium]